MVLGIDTSGENLGLAVCRRGEILASSLTKPGLRHGEILQQAIGEFLKENRLGFNELSGVSVTLGPGSFTGLRIGLAAAKGYSYSMRIPLAGVSTLLAGAWAFSNYPKKVVVIIDARRNEYYSAVFDCSHETPARLSPDTIGRFDDFKEYAAGDVVFFGSSQLKELFVSKAGQYEFHLSDDFNLAEPASRLGEQDISDNRNLDTASVVPFYLRHGF